MYSQDTCAAVAIRQADDDLAIEPSRPQQCRIKNVRPIRRGQDNNFLPLVESVEFAQELVQGLLALVIYRADAGSPAPPDRVEFIDEKDCRSGFLGLAEEVAHTAG